MGIYSCMKVEWVQLEPQGSRCPEEKNHWCFLVFLVGGIDASATIGLVGFRFW